MIGLGRRVSVHFVGRLDDGSEFANSYKGGGPLEFVVGAPHAIPGLDRAISDMGLGERRSVRIPAAEAYGAYSENLVERVLAKDFPGAERLPVGGHIVLSTPEGQMRVKVLGIEDGLVSFDHNHELAGRDLDLDIELVKVWGVSGSNIENERYMTGTCGCGCDEMRRSLGADAGGCAHDHAHPDGHTH
jgi:FKBP-type peptidyl-prolyl cis-trans isomerase 2